MVCAEKRSTCVPCLLASTHLGTTIYPGKFDRYPIADQAGSICLLVSANLATTIYPGKLDPYPTADQAGRVWVLLRRGPDPGGDGGHGTDARFDAEHPHRSSCGLQRHGAATVTSAFTRVNSIEASCQHQHES